MSCDDKILKINDSYIQGISEGKTTLHIETWNGIKKDIPVKVDIIPVENIYITDITRHTYFNTVDKNEEISIDTEVYPDNATYKELIWSSSDNNIISVKDNKFNINGTGKVTLTCTAHGDITNNISFMIIDQNLIIISLIIAVGVASLIFILVFKRRKNNKLKL